jgi:hypothetical protein
MLERDLAYALDPVAFAAERCKIVLDPVQAELVRSRGRRELVNCTRQWGKTTSTAVAALHEGNYVRGSLTILISATQRQSLLLLSRIADLSAVAGIAASPIAGADPGLRLPVGEVIALPGSEATTRGFSGCTWLIVDEAARVPDALYHSARAYLATTDGRVWLLSTPFGQRGFFYHESQSGRYRVTRVPAADCPRISPAFLQEQKASMPASWFAQEYCCEFTSVDDAVFTHDEVVRSLSGEVEPLCL